MIQKVSNKNNLSIFDVLSEKENVPTRANEDKVAKTDWAGYSENREPEMKSAWRKKREEEKKAERNAEYSREPLLAQKLKHNSPLDIENTDHGRSSHSIRSARSAGDDLVEKLNCIKDTGGSSRMTISNKNSIFNPNALVEAMNTKTLEDNIKNQVDRAATKRQEINQQYREAQIPETSADDFAFMNKNSILKAGKSQHIVNSAGQRRTAVPSKNISMFDETDFQNLKPTLGEQMEKKAETKEEKTVSKTISTKEIQSSFFDKMASSEENIKEKSNLKYGNPRKNSQETFDHLIDILNKKNG